MKYLVFVQGQPDSLGENCSWGAECWHETYDSLEEARAHFDELEREEDEARYVHIATFDGKKLDIVAEGEWDADGVEWDF